MKRYWLLLLAECLAFCAQAQGIYDIVLGNAVRMAKTPVNGFMQGHLAAFQCSALAYIKEQSDSAGTIDKDFLDTQAYYLSVFCELYFKKAVSKNKAKEKKTHERMRLFETAAAEHPLLSATKDKTRNEGDTAKWSKAVPFSINTNWEQAYKVIEQALQEKCW